MRALLVVLGLGLWLGAPALAQTKPLVTGAGSTWSQIAVDQWRADVNRFGLRINYQGVGSSQGRQNYINDLVDFAVSEIPFEGQELDALRAQNKQWAYLPIVAGGTSFMYNLKDGSGQAITSLRLSSSTAVGIFTGTIKKWNDPAIVAENAGVTLPDLDVIPVLRSDGSGTTAQFTAYLSKMEHDKWCAFVSSKQPSAGCGHTSSYPEFPGSVGQQGSDGVANFVHSEATGQGAITYVETGYALQRGRPVAFLRNGSGGYTLPTSSNVATALKRATLNSDRTQNLDDVYVNQDATAYAMSSYSYMIVPTAGIDPAKGDVLGRFMAYFACDGQRKADQLGYAPLPQNLVEVVFDAIRQVPGAPAPPAISECSNPTIAGGTGATSDDTAAALSGGTSTSGSVPASAVPAPASGTTSSTGATGGDTAGAGSTTGAGGTTGGAANGSVAEAGGGSTANGGTGSTGGALGVGGALGSLDASGDGTYTAADGTLSSQSAQQTRLGANDSSTPLMGAGLAVAFLVFAPPVLSAYRVRDKRSDLLGR